MTITKKGILYKVENYQSNPRGKDSFQKIWWIWTQTRRPVLGSTPDQSLHTARVWGCLSPSQVYRNTSPSCSLSQLKHKRENFTKNHFFSAQCFIFLYNSVHKMTAVQRARSSTNPDVVGCLERWASSPSGEVRARWVSGSAGVFYKTPPGHRKSHPRGPTLPLECALVTRHLYLDPTIAHTGIWW